MSPYVAESPRLWLQPLNVDEHLNDFYAIMMDPRSMFWSTGSAHANMAQSEELIVQCQPTPEKPWNRRFAVLLRPDASLQSPDDTVKPKMIGVVGTPRESEVAYKLHPDYWGKGYMPEALCMFIKLYWQFEETKSNPRILAFADPENAASNRVLEKAGFQKGEFRKAFYERAALNGAKKSDLQGYYLERPEDSSIKRT